MSGLTEEVLIQAIEFPEFANMSVTADGMADGPCSGEADLAAALSG